MRANPIHVVLVVILTLHGGLLAWNAAQHSPVVAEVNHLPAGLSHWYLGRFDLFRVNPPLVRMVAALPVMFMSPATDWKKYDATPTVRSDLAVSQDFLAANGSRSLDFFTIARWACIPFSILGGYICFRWGRELYGTAAGFCALILWCFCPYILGHAALLAPDAHSAAMGVMAYYFFWRWLNRPSWQDAIFAGIALGIAELCKFTLLVFYPLWIATWIVYRLPDFGFKNPKRWFSESQKLLGIMLLSVLVINCGYEFEGTFKPLGKYQFSSRLFTGVKQGLDASGKNNRFADSWLGTLPAPLPANFVQGIDMQRLDFERGVPSYLHGKWSKHGWWHYYLYALAIKLPLGTLGLIALSIVCMFWKTFRSSWRNEFVLLLPIVAILAILSSQTGFSIHSRYAIPILPFAYVWCSKLARSIDAKRWGVVVVGSALLCWSVGSSLWYYPHSLSYFNELVGGPLGGHAHLLDSNIAWGQDLYYLKRWYDRHPEARPLHLAHYELMDERLAGLEFTTPPVGPKHKTSKSDPSSETMGPLPGWYAIDMNYLHGATLTTADGQGGWRNVSSKDCDLTYFQRFQPIAKAGYSIYIYHIKPEEANRVRRELGMPELEPFSPPSKKTL